MSEPDSESDDARLDRLFGELVERLSRGESIAADTLLPDRPDLRERVAEMLALAESIAVVKPRVAELPVFPGYELLRELGRGGMGTVYLARQVNLDRVVALKTTLATQRGGSRGRQRFEREIKAIARLRHPAILPVYDQGEHRGVAYFTMEYISGRSLADLIRALEARRSRHGKLAGDDIAAEIERLPESVRSSTGDYCERCARIALDIARALGHAHAHGVVHRDVKPSNILIRRDGQPLLFDFGLADLDDELSLTRTGDFVGSPYYTSPEQAFGRREEVGPQTDVYALGVTLFELLTLQLPFLGSSTQAILERIRDQEPPPPRTLNGDIPPDLETIVLTAMEKDRSRRYATAEALAADLDRYLSGEPIAARPVSSATRFLRRVKRHKARTTALVLGFLFVTITPSALFFLERDAKRRIEIESSKAKRINEFLEGLLASASPDQLGHEALVVDVLKNAEQRLATMHDAPEVSISLHHTVGKTYEAIGEVQRATDLLEKAAELAESLPAGHRDRLEALVSLGWNHKERGDLAKARPALERAVAECRAALREEDELLLAARNNLALVIGALGERKSAMAELEQVLAIRRRARGDVAPTTLATQYNLATLSIESGAVEAGRALLSDVLEKSRGRTGMGVTRIGAGKYLANLTLMIDRRPDQALLLLEDVLTDARTTRGEENPVVLTLENDRAGVQLQLGRLNDALGSFRRLLDIRLRTSGPEHQETAVVANNLAYALNLSGRHVEARELVDRLSPGFDRALGKAHRLAFDFGQEGVRASEALRDPIDALERVARYLDADLVLSLDQQVRIDARYTQFLTRLGHPAEAAAFARTALGSELGEWLRGGLSLLEACVEASIVARQTQGLEDALRALRDALLANGGSQALIVTANLDVMRARIALIEDRAADAEPLATAAYLSGKRNSGSSFAALNTVAELVVEARHASGDLTGAERFASEHLEDLRQRPSGDPSEILAARGILARARLDAGDDAGAEAELEDIACTSLEIGEDPEARLEETTALAKIVESRGDREAAIGALRLAHARALAAAGPAQISLRVLHTQQSLGTLLLESPATADEGRRILEHWLAITNQLGWTADAAAVREVRATLDAASRR